MLERKRLCRILLLVGLVAVAMANSACETYVGVGVGYGYPGYWGGPWPGGYYGGPVYIR
jgi:hypothetical protein